MKITYSNDRKGERPHMNLTVCRVESKTWWDLNISKHHYMSQEMNKGAKCFLFQWDGVPVGFFSILNQTFKGCNKNDHRGSRTVIFPQFQGLGFSKVIVNFVASIVKSLGGTLYMKERHDKMAKWQSKSPDWQPTAYNGKKHHAKDPKSKNRFARVSYCYKYVGEPIYGFEELLLPIKELRKRKGLPS